jgi:hypothetical protein
MSMIKSPLGFLDVCLEVPGSDAAHLCEARLSDPPETLDAVDMSLAVGEDILGMFHTVMPLVADIGQAVIGLPFIGVNHGVVRDKSPDYRHERGGRAVLHDLREHPFAALFHAEDDGLAARAAPSFAPDAACPEVGFVQLHLAAGEGGFAGGHLRDSSPREGENTVDSVAVETRHSGDLNPAQIKREETEQLPEFGLCNSRTAHILVSHR